MSPRISYANGSHPALIKTEAKLTHAFGPETNDDEIYEVIHPLVELSMSGGSAAVMCYGMRRMMTMMTIRSNWFREDIHDIEHIIQSR